MLLTRLVLYLQKYHGQIIQWTNLQNFVYVKSFEAHIIELFTLLLYIANSREKHSNKPKIYGTISDISH